MMEPWFDAELYAWIPGTAYGVISGVLGGLVGWLLPRGRAMRPLLAAWYALWAVGLALLLAGLIALKMRQPYGVWYGLLLPGVIGTLVVGANTFTVMRAYRRVEERRLAAKDLL